MTIRQLLCEHDYDFVRFVSFSGGYLTPRVVEADMCCKRCGKIRRLSVTIKLPDGICL